MAAAQVARRSGRAVLAAVLRRLGRGCFLPAFSLLPLLAEQRRPRTAADLAADKADTIPYLVPILVYGMRLTARWRRPMPGRRLTCRRCVRGGPRRPRAPSGRHWPRRSRTGRRPSAPRTIVPAALLPEPARHDLVAYLVLGRRGRGRRRRLGLFFRRRRSGLCLDLFIFHRHSSGRGRRAGRGLSSRPRAGRRRRRRSRGFLRRRRGALPFELAPGLQEAQLCEDGPARQVERLLKVLELAGA